MEKDQPGNALGHYKHSVELRPTWEKAIQALEQCEMRVEAAHSRAAAGTAIAPVAAHEITGGLELTLDPHRTINPDTHGGLLTPLHKATVEADEQSRSFLDHLEKEVEPAIKELSTCLLYPDGSVAQLGMCLEKFETALAGMRTHKDNVRTSVERIRKLGEHLLRS
jgi:hypothetical protein